MSGSKKLPRGSRALVRTGNSHCVVAKRRGASTDGSSFTPMLMDFSYRASTLPTHQRLPPKENESADAGIYRPIEALFATGR
jgi:hypothetical protein